MNGYGYIDADALIEFANNHIGGIDANDIARFPAADVEKVTRCKDCTYCAWDGFNYVCKYSWQSFRTKENDFCSRAEPRKESDK